MVVSILVDGRSGSGKTEFAAALASGWPGAQLVRLDDLYPGWDGLEAGSAAVGELLRDHRWRRWDWAANAAAEWHSVDARRPLIVEGCGALTERHRALASYGIWVELEPEARKRRALDRDGEAYEGHWETWAAQEDAFIDRERPLLHADLLVDGVRAIASASELLPTLMALAARRDGRDSAPT